MRLRKNSYPALIPMANNQNNPIRQVSRADVNAFHPYPINSNKRNPENFINNNPNILVANNAMQQQGLTNEQIQIPNYSQQYPPRRLTQKPITYVQQSVTTLPPLYDSISNNQQTFQNKMKNPNNTLKTQQKLQTQVGNKVTFEDESQKTKLENIGILTGTVERVIKWHKVYEKFCLYEVIASIIGLQEGLIRMQKIMLLRDHKGPILQVVHYVTDYINIDNFYVGQMLRCVGRMIGPNMLHAVSIRGAKPEEIATLQRLSYICDHAVSRAISRV